MATKVTNQEGIANKVLVPRRLYLTSMRCQHVHGREDYLQHDHDLP